MAIRGYGRIRCTVTAVSCVAMLVAAGALAGSATAANEQFSLEMTYTGSGDLTQTRTVDCYDEGGDFHRGVVYSWHTTVQWTTVFAPTIFVAPGAKQLLPGGNQIGVAEYPSHRLSGAYQAERAPCQSAASGTLAEVDGANQPSLAPYMPAFGLLHGTNIEFRLAPTREPGETSRDRMFANGYSGEGYGLSNWDAVASAPAQGGGGPVYSLTGIFTVSLGQLRDLTEGRKASLEIDVAQPAVPGFAPQPPPNGTVAATTKGHVKIIATCHERTKSGPGYAQLEPDTKRALAKLYKELDRQKACYRFTIGYRSKSTQQKLYDRWHEIADRQGPSDHRSADQVCNAVHNAGFAQCPAGRSGRVARGGPAKPGTSRHEHGEAADITVRFPPRLLKNLAKYQAAARRAGLCGPPKGDDVHVELPYAAHGKAVRCHFPPGPAP